MTLSDEKGNHFHMSTVHGLTFFAVLVCTFLCAKVADAEESRAEIVRKFVDKWQMILGPVPFDDPGLFSAMCYLNPQPDGDFVKFKSETLAPVLLRNRELWITKIFKGDFRKMLADARPSAYYLNHGRKEPSLLKYELSLGRYDVSVVENYNVFFVTLKWRDREQLRVLRKDLTAFLSQATEMSFKDEEAIIESFALPERLSVGDTFRNTKENNVAMIRDWNDMVFGFVGEHGASILFFKADGARAELGFHSDFNWLNKALYKEDGITLIQAPVAPGSEPATK